MRSFLRTVSQRDAPFAALILGVLFLIGVLLLCFLGTERARFAPLGHDGDRWGVLDTYTGRVYKVQGHFPEDLDNPAVTSVSLPRW